MFQGIVLVYDVTQRKTFDNVKHWLTDITEVKYNCGKRE